MVPGSNTKPSEENIVMFETAVMVAVVDVLCKSLMSEEHNVYLFIIYKYYHVLPTLLSCTKRELRLPLQLFRT